MKLAKSVLVLFTILLYIGACNRTGSEDPTRVPSTATPESTSVQESATPEDQFASVRAVFAAECVRCHQLDGTGGTVKVDGKRLRVPTLREGHALKHTDEEFVKQIREGGDGMPAFKDKLSDVEIMTLIGMIRKEFQGK